MELCERQSNGDKSSELVWNKISLEHPTVPTSGEARYLTKLWVSGNEEPPEEHRRRPGLSQSISNGFEARPEEFFSYHQEITYKIRAALKLLTFREQHVLVQFWSPRVVGMHRLLATIDQPFGLGITVEELCLYRRMSEQSAYLVDKDHDEQDNNPPARVFRRGLPEWTFDILTNYNPKDFPQQSYAIRCNLRGYMALPVFDSTTGLCVGVLEVMTSSKYMSYAFEVHQIHTALKTENLTSPQAFDSPTTKVLDERKQHELYKIFRILKMVCDIHSLPLAQTWAMSPTSSFVSRDNVIEKSCSSFDSRCIGKDCMSTADLPFHVRDVGMWQFREACKVQHLDRSRGVVGKAMSAHGSCYCEDVTELSEEEYPLVHNARMSRLTSCFTIFLHSLEGNNDDYVLEFFLLLDNKDIKHVLNLVQTLRREVEATSGFELGEISTIEIIGPPKDASFPHAIQISSPTMANTTTFEDSSDSESFLAAVPKTDTVNVLSQWPFKQDQTNKQSGTITNTESWARHDVISSSINVVGSRINDNATSYPNVSTMTKINIFTDAGKTNHRLKQSRKCKIDSLTMKSVEQHLGKPIGQAAKSLGVSRSTLKRFCRVHGISSWPVPKRSNNKTSYVTNPNWSQEIWSQKHLQRTSSTYFTIRVAVFVVIKVKRWSCSSKSHGLSGKWWSCGKHSYLPSKSYSIYQITRLVVGLRRWRRKSSNRHAIAYNHQQLSYSGLVNASSKPGVGNNVLDMGFVMVKVTFNDDMIKFRFPIVSGLLELENEVARRVNVKEGKRLSLKYKDQENDLVSITRDADLHSLREFLANNGTIKLHVFVADDSINLS